MIGSCIFFFFVRRGKKVEQAWGKIGNEKFGALKSDNQAELGRLRDTGRCSLSGFSVAVLGRLSYCSFIPA